MRPFEACPFCNGEFMFDWINDTRRCNNCGALFTWRIIREPSGVPIDLTLQLKKAEDRIAELEAEIDIRKDQLREAKNILIDKKLHIDSLYEEGYKLQQRIAELEAKNEKINYFFRRLRMFCIFAHWDNPNTEDEFYKVDEEIHEYLSEYKVCEE